MTKVKDNRNIIVLDMGIGALSVLNLLKQELSNETIVYMNDLDIENYEGMEFYDIERRIEVLIERALKYNPKLILLANDTLIEYGKDYFEKLNIEKVYIVDEIIEYVNQNYELKNMAFFAPQGIIESNMYQKNFKYTRLYNLNADNMNRSLSNALMKTSESFNDMKIALLPVYKKELDLIISTIPNMLLFQTEIFEYVKGRDVDIIPLDKILVDSTIKKLNTIEEKENDIKIKGLKKKKINIVLKESEEIRDSLFKNKYFSKESSKKRIFEKILNQKYNIITEKPEI